MRPELILLDADGVLWRGGEVIPEAPGFIRRAHAAGMRCLLITNNAGLSRDAYSAKCRRLELDLCEQDIFSSSYIAGPHLARSCPGQRILVIGSPQLVESVAAHCPSVTGAHDWLDVLDLSGWLHAPEQLVALGVTRPDVVLMGLDINIDYATLSLACVCCQSGAALIATNDDPVFPFEHGMIIPGNGSFVALVEQVAGVRAQRLGKPEPYLLEQITLETGVPPQRMVLVGDRVETDIEMARRAGMPSYLVLTGVTTREDAPSASELCSVVDNLDDVAAALGI